MLFQGSKGRNVRQVQEFLAVHGLYEGKIDGFYGAKTARAVGAWQRHIGEKDDTIFGPKTLAATKRELIGNGPGGPAMRPVRRDG